MRFLIVPIAALSLAGCTAAASYLQREYPASSFDGYIREGDTRFSITHHKSRSSFVTQVSIQQASNAAFLSGLTFGGISRDVPGRLHENAATQLVAKLPQHGCRITRSSNIETITYEHDYECRSGYRLTPADVVAATDGGPLTGRATQEITPEKAVPTGR